MWNLQWRRKLLHWVHNPTACNYDDQAITDDGSCLIADCNGDCGGTAVIASCGTCINGLTGLDETACHVCPNQETQDHLESPCGVGLLYGQSFEVENTGYLYSITLSVCATEESRLSIRMDNGTGLVWSEGQLVSESQDVSATASTMSECLPSIHGFSHYALRTFRVLWNRPLRIVVLRHGPRICSGLKRMQYPVCPWHSLHQLRAPVQ